MALLKRHQPTRKSPCGAAQDYAIYEGIIGSWYSHDVLACTDADPLLEEDVDTSAGDRYYLVVPPRHEH